MNMENKLFTWEEELELLTKSQFGDSGAKNRLIQYYMRFVSSIAKKYFGFGLTSEVLIEEGKIGLIHAIDKFNKSRGFKFASYAFWWIRQSVWQALKESGTEDGKALVCEAEKQSKAKRKRKEPTIERYTKFYTEQAIKQIILIDNYSPVFDGAMNGGLAYGKHSPKILRQEDREKNLYNAIRGDAIRYFDDSNIQWWEMDSSSINDVPAHVLSSQVHCLNHLFAIRKNEDAIKAILYRATLRCFDAILPALDGNGLIEFEFTHDNKVLLGEDATGACRGSLCTSIDAMIRAKKDNDIYLIPIEWKYTESYVPKDKTNPIRLKRYATLIEKSEQLITPQDGVAYSIYMQEPQYELMRQTLLMEQMVRNGEATKFIHINVIPNGNTDLRQQVENNYIPNLKDKSLFVCIDPQELLEPLCEEPFTKDENINNLIEYLRTRYFTSNLTLL